MQTYTQSAKVLRATLKNVPFPNIKMSSTTVMRPQGHTVVITGQKIHYEKIGSGHHNVILLPGFLGSSRTDFAPQLENFSQKDFTIYGFDPPGYGFSRPPADGTYHPKRLLHGHSEFAVKLMQLLNVEKVSLVGWSNGGTTAIITAANNPKLVRSMVLIGASSHYTAEEVQMGKTIMRNIDCWGEKQRATMINLYGEEYLRQLCPNSNDCLFSYENHDICTNDLKNIQCPTLITHGSKDILANPDHAQHLRQNIKGSKVVEFADGRHDIHLQFAEKFNKIAQDFLKKN